MDLPWRNRPAPQSKLRKLSPRAWSACFVPTLSIKRADFMDIVIILMCLSIKRADFMDRKCKSTGIYHSLFSNSLKSLRCAWQRSRQIRKCLQSYILTSVDGWSTPASSSKQVAQAKLKDLLRLLCAGSSKLQNNRLFTLSPLSDHRENPVFVIE